jgi:hypothetical protein
MPASREDWERVGRQLAERRVQVDARYANRRLFADETGLNWRTVYDAEYGKRATFRRETVTSFEAAYRLVPGSLARSLAGGPLEPLPSPSLAPVPPRPTAAGSPAEEILADLLGAYPDDKVVQVIGAQAGKPAPTRVAEVLEWLDIQAGRRGNISAGLQEYE